MPKLPDSPRVFLTGGATGLGRALAGELAGRSARILIGDVNVEGAEAAAAELDRAGATVEVRRCDVAKSGDVGACAKAMEQLWGGTDLVVNNAGVAVGGTVGDLALKDWKWIMGINLWGVIHGCHHFVPQMREAGRGAILNVASSAGIVSLPEMAPYNVTKAGVISLSETLRAELAPDGIAVSVLCPTFFASNLMDSFRSSDERQRRLAQALFDRSGVTSDDVAKAALKGLEKGRLVIIPQGDGKLMWGLKRLVPEFYYRRMGWIYGKGRERL